MVPERSGLLLSGVVELYLQGKRRTSRTWPTSEGTRENQRPVLTGRSLTSCGPCMSSGLEAERLVTVDHETGFVRIECDWVKATLHWTARVCLTHGEALSTRERWGRAGLGRAPRENLQRESLREGGVQPVTAILQGIPGILREVSEISRPNRGR